MGKYCILFTQNGTPVKIMLFFVSPQRFITVFRGGSMYIEKVAGTYTSAHQ